MSKRDPIACGLSDREIRQLTRRAAEIDPEDLCTHSLVKRVHRDHCSLCLRPHVKRAQYIAPPLPTKRPMPAPLDQTERVRTITDRVAEQLDDRNHEDEDETL